MKKNKSVLFVLTILALVLAACSAPATEVVATQAPVSELQLCAPESASAGKVNALAMGTGGKGGVFYPYGQGLADILSTNMNGVKVTFVETGGSVDNIKQVQSGELHIGFSTVDSAYDAIKGQAVYADTGKAKICALTVLYTSFVHVIASEASGINSIEDMKGKIVSFGDSGSSTEGAAERLFEAAGLDAQTDVTRENMNITDSTVALSTGAIDAFFWIGGLPTKAVTDMLSTDAKVKFIDANEYINSLVEKYGPVYSAFTLSKDVYGTQADVPGIGIGNILFVNENMNEDQAYQILKTTFDHLDEVHALHAQAANLQLQTAITGSSIPFHPGAIKYFTEQGVWK